MTKRTEAEAERLRASRIAGLRASAEYAAELVTDQDTVRLLTRKRPPVALTTKDEFKERIFGKP